MPGTLGRPLSYNRELAVGVMGEMVIFKDTKNGKVAVIFKRDGSVEHQAAFQCETCYQYYPESQLFSKWLNDEDCFMECEECRK